MTSTGIYEVREHAYLTVEIIKRPVCFVFYRSLSSNCLGAGTYMSTYKKRAAPTGYNQAQMYKYKP